MKILAIETSGKVCAVAINENEKLIRERIIEDENTHSVKLMSNIDKLLEETNLKLEDIDMFACDVGPGSFTGIRIGVATIKAFLDVMNKKVVGISSLENQAYNLNKDGIICSLIDAKNNNVYCGFFEKNEHQCKQIGILKFDSINNILDSVKNIDKKIFFIGNGSIQYKDMIESEVRNSEVILEKEVNTLNAKNIALASFFKKSEAVNSNELKPIYLRQSSAERLQEKE